MEPRKLREKFTHPPHPVSAFLFPLSGYTAPYNMVKRVRTRVSRILRNIYDRKGNSIFRDCFFFFFFDNNRITTVRVPSRGNVQMFREIEFRVPIFGSEINMAKSV